MEPVSLLKNFPSAMPVYYRLQQTLIANIMNGLWKVGEQIPSERELSQSCGVSVGTVRKSLEKLVQAGYLTRHQGKGSFVADPAKNRTFVNKYYNMRLSLREKDVPLLVSCLGIRQEQGTEALNPCFDYPTDQRFLCIERLFYGNSTTGKTPLLHCFSYFPRPFSDRLSTISDLEVENKSLYLLVEQYCETPLVHSEETLGIVPASAETAHYLAIPEGTPVLRSTMRSVNYEGTTIEFRLSFIRVDQFELVRVHEFTL